ncbi:PRC-barrel domain-containing protein [Devosia rhodophyticola]|uniref:PRC-barrel domain-containing protein n=1 Tax=Devosia rhodophyticola TaxID=3026423 RepID=A0ABY7YUC9_9HYPH|nr:PRC-barrel domain-containing protein [Devosia rhodophyticola]WDR04958.1 PRC-barrel domain-containing protein [Devosia rhodophyticola]
MIRPMLCATVLMATLVGQSPAQDVPLVQSTELEKVGLTPPTVLSQGYEASSDDQLTSNIIGQVVFGSAGRDAAEIGPITDLVLTAANAVSAAVIDVGSIVGEGRKLVAVDFSQLQRVKASDGSFRYVMSTSTDAMAAAPTFIWGDSEAAIGPALTPEQEAAQMVDGDPNTLAVDPTTTTDQPQSEANISTSIDGVQMTPMDVNTLNPDQLYGIAVYGIDQQIGTVNSVVSNRDGTIDAIVVDVGGFLGLGAKPVAVGTDNINVSMDVNDTRYVFLNTTKAQLEAQKAYDPASYEADRINQRMVIEP